MPVLLLLSLTPDITLQWMLIKLKPIISIIFWDVYLPCSYSIFLKSSNGAIEFLSQS